MMITGGAFRQIPGPCIGMMLSISRRVFPMEQISLDSKRFPQIYKRFTPDRMNNLLVRMCQGLNIEVTEANLYAMAANVERDLRRLFA